jgi:hypothetical protein
MSSTPEDTHAINDCCLVGVRPLLKDAYIMLWFEGRLEVEVCFWEVVLEVGGISLLIPFLLASGVRYGRCGL